MIDQGDLFNFLVDLYELTVDKTGIRTGAVEELLNEIDNRTTKITTFEISDPVIAEYLDKFESRNWEIPETELLHFCELGNDEENALVALTLAAVQAVIKSAKRESKDETSGFLECIGTQLDACSKGASSSEKTEDINAIVSLLKLLEDQVTDRLANLEGVTSEYDDTIDKLRQEHTAGLERMRSDFVCQIRDEVDLVKGSFQGEIESIRTELNKTRSDNILILGIFVSVIAAIMGGFSLTTSIGSAIIDAGYSKYLIVEVVCLLTFAIIAVLATLHQILLSLLNRCNTNSSE